MHFLNCSLNPCISSLPYFFWNILSISNKYQMMIKYLNVIKQHYRGNEHHTTMIIFWYVDNSAIVRTMATGLMEEMKKHKLKQWSLDRLQLHCEPDQEKSSYWRWMKEWFIFVLSKKSSHWLMLDNIFANIALCKKKKESEINESLRLSSQKWRSYNYFVTFPWIHVFKQIIKFLAFFFFFLRRLAVHEFLSLCYVWLLYFDFAVFTVYYRFILWIILQLCLLFYVLGWPFVSIYILKFG